MSQVTPQALPLQSAVASATVVVQGAAAVETKRHPFESVLQVSIFVLLVQTCPAWGHVGLLLQMQLAEPAAPEQTSCVAHGVVACARQPFESGVQVTSAALPLQ